MEHRHVVLAETQVLDGGFQFLRCREEIGKNDDQRTLPDLFGGIVQRSDERRAATRLDASELVHDGAKVCRAAFGGDVDRLVSEGPKPYAVALLRGEIAERAAKFFGVVEPRRAGRPEIHRAASVEEQAKPQVGVSFKLLDVEAVAAPPGSPIEAAGVVAGDVFAVLREFQR